MAAVKQNANCHTPLHSFDMYILLPCFIFSIKNPESEETKQCQRGVRLFRLLNLFCCYFFFFFFDGQNYLLHFYNVYQKVHETLTLFIWKQFAFLFSFGRLHRTAFLLLTLNFSFLQKHVHMFNLKINYKTCKHDDPPPLPTRSTYTFRDFHVGLLKKKLLKKKGENSKYLWC